ncbi:MAG: GTPase Era [Alphaproteobacteria bacterium]|nr:GTPase Era [Alphaproteobacteria bacterium]MCY4496011.1 GTPase Era [Rhodospirillaceae bacterium]
MRFRTAIDDMAQEPEGRTRADARCGVVALVGAPNAGKSTLLNAFVGTKVSIVTPKVQTTRARVIGVAVEGCAQFIFVDTPGIFFPRRRLERAMVDAAWSGAHDADAVVLLVDSRRPTDTDDDDTARVVRGLAEADLTTVLALNKIDLVEKSKLLALSGALNGSGAFRETFMISALSGDGVGDLRNFLTGTLPEGPWLYPEDQVAVMPMRLLAAETTREKLFMQLHQELPYHLTVETEGWEERPDGSVKIDQMIYVSRNTHKGIVLGKGGKLIKSVGSASRIELENAMQRRVHLFLHVKVREGWLDEPARYQEMGLEFPN